MSGMGGKRTGCFAARKLVSCRSLSCRQHRFACISPSTTSSGWRNKPILCKESNGVFTGSHSLVIQPIGLPTAKILLAHPSKRGEQLTFVIGHRAPSTLWQRNRYVRHWAKLPTAGDRTRTRCRDRCSDTSTNSATLARTMFGQIPLLSNVRFWVARFAGGMAMFGRKRNVGFGEESGRAVAPLSFKSYLFFRKVRFRRSSRSSASCF